MLLRIQAPHFTAGIELAGSGTPATKRGPATYRRVVKCAPIVSYMQGWPLTRILDYCRRKNWTVTGGLEGEVDAVTSKSP